MNKKRLYILVTDGEVEECMDPGGNGAILNVGEGGGPSPPRGRETGSWHQTVEEVRHSRCWKARGTGKPALCTEYISYV